MKRIAGIDPGFDRIGMAIIEGERGREKLVYSCSIITPRKEKHEKRLVFLAREVKKIVKKFKPEMFAVEKLFFNQNITNALKVAEARGVILLIAGEFGLPVYEYSPQEIKATITGYGKAQKKQLMLLISKIIFLPTKRDKMLDDEYDAIAVALTHSAYKNSYYPQ